MTFLELSLSGGVFILAIAAFRWLALRRLPKGTFVALWWLAAARLLLPVELASRFSVYTLLEALGPKAVPVAPNALPAPVIPAAPAVPVAPPVIALPTQPAAVPAPAPAPFPVWTALWLSVGLLLAAWFLIRYVRWRRRFREALPADCPGLETWFQFRRRVEVRVTDQIAAPLTYGLFRPVILLPKTMDFKDEEALTCVLAHERAHIRRLDGLLKLALTAAACLHWFNPAVWVLYVLGNRDMELRCDEAAVLALGEDSRERYALALIRLAENRNVPLCGFAHRNGMEERIKAIMSIKKKSLLACAVALALVLGITTAFATSAKPQEAERPEIENPTDRELLAESSAESAAMWEETLAPYEPFGLTWTFDDPDLDGNGLTMTWEGHEVRGIYDEGKYAWITEHAGDSTFGPDAVELYTIYENGKLTGLRLATEEEQKSFDRDRKLNSDTRMTMVLGESVRYDSGHIYFTIPESEEPWSIFIQGRVLMEDGSGQSVRYLEKESEQAEWVPQMTYSFEVADAAYDELTMDVRYGNAHYCYPLTPLLPENQKPLPVEPLRSGKEDIPEGTEMIWPVDSAEVTAPQETQHSGVDIGAEKGTPVYAAGKGTVKEAGFNAQDGNFIRIDHGRGQETFYAHCEKLLVKTGDAVELGQTIATVGSTGQSTGPHLHFEFRVNGVATDPLAFCRTDYQNNDNSQINPFWASVGIKANPKEDSGKPIIAIMNGTVLDAGMKEKGEASGLYVEILYENNYSMKFQGCQSILVKTGDSVKTGDVIAYAGEGLSGKGPSTPQDRADEERNRQEVMARMVNGDYPRNSRGETYGKYGDAKYMGHEPDLIGAVTTEGLNGWVYSEMLVPPAEDVMTPEQMADYQESLKIEGFHLFRFDIPVYDDDGKQIGVFERGIQIGNHPFSTMEEAREAVANGWPDNQ